MVINLTTYCIVLILIQIAAALDVERTVSGNSSSPNTYSKQGWTSQPDGRGTLDILWNCGFTMFLCSWSILCLNVPGRDEERFQILWRKLSLAALGVLCPELVFEIAFGQWLSARQSVKDMNSTSPGRTENKWYKLGKLRHISIENISVRTKHAETRRANQTWSMKEAFFTDMGGFILRTRDSTFPLDAQQLYYLVKEGFIPQRPILTKQEIAERNKVDSLLRAITLCLITWFLINTVARRAQHLIITTAELTTVSFILCSLGTAFFWWHKPADAVTGKFIDIDASINDILEAARQPLDAWKRSPLDFVSRKEWWWSKCWSNFVSILRNMRITFGSDVVPIDRIPDTLQRELSSKPMYTGMGVTAGYFSILFIGWNYSFPTRTEQILWRAACVTLMASLLALTFMSSLASKLSDLEHYLRKLTGLHSPRRKYIDTGCRARVLKGSRLASQRLNRAFDSVRNNSVGKDPLLYIPLRVIIPIYIIAVFYCHARTYILIADIIELRSLPESAYATVAWQKFWPHLG